MAKELTLDEIEHWKQMVPSDYLRGIDLISTGDKGATLTIKGVTKSEEFKAAQGKSKIRPAIRFNETPKIWGPCGADMNKLQIAYGPPRDWAGHTITVVMREGVRRPDGSVGPAVRIKVCHK